MTIPATLFRLLLIAIFAASASYGQQVRRLQGKVKPERQIHDCRNDTVDWSKISVKVTSNGQVIPPEPLYSKGEDWSHSVPVGTRVDIGFSFACYRPWQMDTYTVRPESDPQTLSEVLLRPLPNCPYCPRRASSRSKTTNAIAGATGTEVASPSSIVEYGAIAKVRSEGDEPSPAQLQADLQEDARIALKFGFFDVFQYNFEVLSVTLVKPELANVLREFRTNPEHAALFEPLGNRRPETFRKLVGSQFTNSEPIDFPLIGKIVEDPALDPSIRGSAIVMLLESKLNSPQKADFQKILRTQSADPANVLSLAATIGLARIGTDKDRARIMANSRSSDENLAVMSMTALRVAQITEGASKFSWAIRPLAKIVNSAKQPAVRQAAIQALRPSIYYLRNPFAIVTLSNILKDDSNPDAVRAEAARGLGVGTLEQRFDVRGVLLTAAKDPSSELVRQSAIISLKGREQF